MLFVTALLLLVLFTSDEFLTVAFVMLDDAIFDVVTVDEETIVFTSVDVLMLLSVEVLFINVELKIVEVAMYDRLEVELITSDT